MVALNALQQRGATWVPEVTVATVAQVFGGVGTRCVRWGADDRCQMRRDARARRRVLCRDERHCVPSLLRRVALRLRRVKSPRTALRYLAFVTESVRRMAPPAAPVVVMPSPLGMDASLSRLYQSVVRGKGRSAASQQAAVVGHGVEVRISSIPGAGNGLFATRAFRRHEWITGMDGVVFGGPDRDRENVARGHPWSHFRQVLHGNLWLDGIRMPNPPAGVGGGSYANDRSYNVTTGTVAVKSNNNACYEMVYDPTLPTVPVTFLRAVKDILPGEEVTVNYGRVYWKRYLPST